MIVTLSLGETCVGKNLAPPSLESGQIEVTTVEGSKGNAGASWYDASGYAVAPRSGTRALRLPTTDGSLRGTSTLGYTTPNGQVFLKPGLSRAEQASTLRHEGVHAFFSPKGTSSVARFRQNLGQAGYDNSQLLRFTEEAIAETIGSGSLRQGILHPLRNGYGITGSGLATEGLLLGGGLFGAGYYGYQIGSGGE